MLQPLRKSLDALREAVSVKDNPLTVVDRSHPYLLGMLWAVFAACLAIRFWYVFYNGPLNHLFSDPGRHWINGTRFFWPHIMGSIDPFMYQFWLRALQWLDHSTGYVVLTGTGVLSMALPFFWFKASRELLPLPWALTAAIAIGFMPSLFMIYSYFMNETLLLTLSAVGFWLTLRAMRTKDMPTLVAIALVWAAAGYTRIIALPLAALCFVAVLTRLSWRKRAAFAIAICVCFGAFAYPACWHSSKNLNYCAPFGSGYFNAIYRASSAKTMGMKVLKQGEWEFSSPSMYTKPLAPLSDWQSSRTGTYLVTIDPSKGREDWETMLLAIREYGPGLPWLDDKIENAAMLLFDPSWPDTNQTYTWGWLSYWNRWLWLPLTIAVALWMLKVRPNARDGLIPFSALALIALLLVQTNGVMEGRYRKPAEPLLIAGAFVLLHRLRTARETRDTILVVADSGN